jgi:hypothetical protein
MRRACESRGWRSEGGAAASTAFYPYSLLFFHGWAIDLWFPRLDFARMRSVKLSRFGTT